MLIQTIDNEDFAKEMEQKGYTMSLISRKHEVFPAGSYVRYLYDLKVSWDSFYDLDEIFKAVERHKNVTIVRL